MAFESRMTTDAFIKEIQKIGKTGFYPVIRTIKNGIDDYWQPLGFERKIEDAVLTASTYLVNARDSVKIVSVSKRKDKSLHIEVCGAVILTPKGVLFDSFSKRRQSFIIPIKGGI